MAAERGDAPALQLGCSAFGGPIAHLGIFRRSCVERWRWLDADTFAGIVALCQLLPGPTSSQVGFLIGCHRAGWRGAMAAWLWFTLPSAILMIVFAIMAPHWHGPCVLIFAMRRSPFWCSRWWPRRPAAVA